MKEQLSMDSDSLFREETFTDRRVGTIQRLTPVTANGDEDPGRAVRYFGQTQVMSPAGALPINFELEVDSLAAALEQFPATAQKAVEDTIEELKRLQREAQSSIMVPGQDSGLGASAGGMPKGGMPGGGFKL